MYLFKKISAIVSLLLIIFCLSFAFVGCDKPEDELPPDTRPTINIGSDEYTPYFYIDESGNYAGIDVEIATEAFSRMGYRTNFEQIVWSDKESILSSKKIDCLWGSFSMDGREDRYNWAGPYLTSRQVVAVSKNSNIKKLSDLADKSVACQSTSKPDEIFSRNDDPRIPPIKNLYCFPYFDQVFAALRKSYVDAIAGHETAMIAYMNSTSGEYVILGETLAEVHLGVAFSLTNNTEIPSRLTATLAEMASDGTTAKIIAKYNLSADRVCNPYEYGGDAR